MTQCSSNSPISGLTLRDITLDMRQHNLQCQNEATEGEAILCRVLLLVDLYIKDYRRYTCVIVHLVGHKPTVISKI